MAHDENHLLCDTMEQFGQALAMGCLVVTKMRDRRVVEDQRIQENVELRKEIERLQFELKHSNILQQEVERLQAEKAKEAADRAQEAASLAEERNKVLAEVDNLKGELSRKDEDLVKTTKSFKEDAAQSYLVRFEEAIEQASTLHPNLTSQNSVRVKPWSMVN